MKITALKLQFIINAPDTLEEGVFYYSPAFQTSLHLCPCGCGNEIVIPFTKDDWELLIVNNLTITVRPSIGNFYLPCKSHYYITNNTIEWC